MEKTLDTLHHIAIQVKDIQQTVSWYQEHFNCQVDYQDDSWAMLKFDNVYLALVLPEQHPYHFAILADNLEEYGQPVSHRDKSLSVYIKDNNGNNIEMLKLPPEGEK